MEKQNFINDNEESNMKTEQAIEIIKEQQHFLKRHANQLSALCAASVLVSIETDKAKDRSVNFDEYLFAGTVLLRELIEKEIEEEEKEALCILGKLSEALAALTPPDTGLEVRTVSEAMALLQSISDLHGGDTIVQDEKENPLNIVYYDEPSESDYSCVMICGG
jgi:hypothetical protein